MARLLITIFVILIASLAATIFGVNKLDRFLFSRYYTDYYHQVHAGTFKILDEQIAGKNGDELEVAIDSIQAQFNFPIDLLASSETDLSNKALKILAKGRPYLNNEGDSSSIFISSKHHDLIWSLAVDMTVEEENLMAAIGPLNVLQKKLKGLDKAGQYEALASLNNYYDLPMALVEYEQLQLSTENIAKLKDKEIVYTASEDAQEHFYIEIDGHNLVLVAGPIYDPAGTGYLSMLLLLLAIATLLAGCLLWVWPLWRDLRQLKDASQTIGNGQLDTRVKSYKTSLIKPVLDGFNHMAGRTQNMVASQQELTNAVSHELRTPLARMMFDLEMAKVTTNADDRSRHLESLEINVTELNSLVDELLTYAKQERVESELELEAFDDESMEIWLSEQLDRANRSRDNSCEIELIVDIDATSSFYFSPSLMAHAMSNAVQNAIKYAEQKVEVYLQEHDNQWLIAVEDDGPGIPTSERERVFEPFSRLDESRQRGSGGFGLGLSIVKKIARWHQGDALITQCQSLTGTRIEIRWPMSPKFDL